MNKIIAVYLVCMAITLLAVMAVQFYRRTHDLLSIRNFALLGFIVFQVLSPVGSIWSQWNNRYALTDWTGVSVEYAAMATVFLVLFFISYNVGTPTKQLARITPTTKIIPNLPTMMILSIVLTAGAVFFKFLIVVPYIDTVAGKVSMAFAAIAVGLAGWVWAPRLLNPLIMLFVASIGLVNFLLVIVDAFGRRSLVALGACLLVGMYYSWWRYRPPTRVLALLAIPAIPAVLAVAVFTSARSSGERPSLGQQIRNILQADLRVGLMDLAQGQNCGPTSMWLIENYPDRYEYRYFNVIKYFVVLPIPRNIWREKPYPLSTEIAENADIEGVRQDQLKIGPGILGHAGAEGGWIALLVYGIVSGLFIRYFDELIQLQPLSPMVVLPVGSAMGQVIGMPRGETSNFAFNYVISVVGAYLTLLVFAKMIEILGWGRSADDVYLEAAYAAEQEELAEHAPIFDGHRALPGAAG